MSDLLVIGYPDTQTAHEAARKVEELAKDLVIEPDAIAVLVREPSGNFRVTTNHNPVGISTTWGMFWGLLFGLLFFVPVLGVAFGAGLGALAGLVDKAIADRDFKERVKDMMQPGTSALFLVLEKVTPDRVTEALAPFGGTVLKSSLSRQAEAELQQSLHGHIG